MALNQEIIDKLTEDGYIDHRIFISCKSHEIELHGNESNDSDSDCSGPDHKKCFCHIGVPELKQVFLTNKNLH